MNGDLINNALKTSKSDTYKEQMTMEEEQDLLIELLTPIKNKILVDWVRDEGEIKKENGSHNTNRFYEGKKKKVICNGNGVFLTFILYHKLHEKSTEKIEKLHIF